MIRTTTDRGEIIHLAGFRQLSPALDGRSAPAFSSAAGDGLARCGWERFFSALRAGALAVEYDPADAATTRLVGRGAGTAPGRSGLAEALDRSARLWRALFPRKPPPET